MLREGPTNREEFQSMADGNGALWDQLLSLGLGTRDTLRDHPETRMFIRSADLRKIYDSLFYPLISQTSVLEQDEGRAFLALTSVLGGLEDPWCNGTLDGTDENVFWIDDLPDVTSIWAQAVHAERGEWGYIVALREEADRTVYASITRVSHAPGSTDPITNTIYYEFPIGKRPWCFENSPLGGPLESMPGTKLIRILPLRVYRIEDLEQMTMDDIGQLERELHQQHADMKVTITGTDRQGEEVALATIAPHLLKGTLAILALERHKVRI